MRQHSPSSSDFLARLGLKARVLARLLGAYGLVRYGPEPSPVASEGFGLLRPASHGFVSLRLSWLISHGLYVL
jgi:hypothetical protein